uniref:NADH dehydrogenase subunit 5 n=1 Tax=Tetrahymena rostrata TaxID=5909 RepID=A0A650DE48_TETRO|nr:NADH dehydrogenase subunit 5 [Tetrahymena rostrata]
MVKNLIKNSIIFLCNTVSKKEIITNEVINFINNIKIFIKKNYMYMLLILSIHIWVIVSIEYYQYIRNLNGNNWTNIYTTGSYSTKITFIFLLFPLWLINTLHNIYTIFLITWTEILLSDKEMLRKVITPRDIIIHKLWYYDMFLNIDTNSFKLKYLYNFLNNFSIKNTANNFYEYLVSYPIFLFTGLLFLFTTLFSLLCLSYLGLYGVFVLNLLSISLFWFSMIFYFDNIMSNNGYYLINLGKWMYLSSGYKVSFDLLIDSTSISFSFLTLTIGIFVYIYTFSYFRYEPLVERLMLFLNLFMISMILLVSSGNFIVMFLGWELIGLTSFFLINFWSTRVGTLKAAFKAFSFNKLSDLFLFFAILLIFNTTYNLDILTFNSQIFLYESYTIEISYFSINLIEIISFFFISCAFIKSAQLGAHIWLPDSMEAPVPASALIHSATLVSAGIYLLLRLSPLFELSYYAYYVIPTIGSLTAFYGGIVSAFQSDTKKTLAYSTISHCGFLMVTYSTGVFEYVILYLYVHGFFKAATFLCMGNVNRFNRNIQDFKRMGGFYKYLPFECYSSFVCMINLSGLPLTLGFYIKHLLFIGLNNSYIIYYVIYSSLILGATAGVFYSYRLFYSIFFDVKKGKKTIYTQANRKNLNSIYYTNTSLASNIAIISLVVISYITTLYLYNTTLNKFYLLSDLKTLNLNNGYSYFYAPDNNFLNTISILNWFIIILIISVIFLNWRQTYYYSTSIDSLGKFILFSYFFYLITKYII